MLLPPPPMAYDGRNLTEVSAVCTAALISVQNGRVAARAANVHI